MATRTLGSRVGLAVCVASALFVLVPPQHGAAVTLGRELRISGALATGMEGEPAIAYNSVDGEYLVVWSDERRAAARGAEIFGRRVAPDGTRLAPDFTISGRNAVDARYPAVAFDSVDDEYLVVWSDGRNVDTRGSDLYARRVAADGDRLGRDRRISSASAIGDETAPAIVHDAVANEYYVVWSDWRHAAIDDRQSDIFGRRVSAAGERIGFDRHIGGRAHAGQWESTPALAIDPTRRRVLVAWQDEYYDALTVSAIRGRLIGRDGEPIGASFRISSNPWRNWEPAVVFHPGRGAFLVVWENGNAPFESDVYGRWIRRTGSRHGSPFPISSRRGETTEGSPSAAVDGDGLLVVWAETRHDDYVVAGVHVDAAGSPIGAEFRVSSHAAATTLWPALGASSHDGRWLVAWSDGRDQETRGTDIYARVLGS